MVRKVWLLLFLFVIQQSGAQPVMILDKGTYHFGTIEEGRVVTHSFTIENRGNEQLLVRTLGSACPCATIDYVEETVAPGDTGTIQVSLHSAGLFGKVQKELYLESNDPDASNFTLALKGTIVEVIGGSNLIVKPETWDFGIAAQDESVRIPVHFINSGDEELVIEEVQFLNFQPSLSVSFPLRILPAEELEMLILFNTGENRGVLHRKVKIKTEGGQLIHSLVGYVVTEKQIRQLLWLM